MTAVTETALISRISISRCSSRTFWKLEIKGYQIKSKQIKNKKKLETPPSPLKNRWVSVLPNITFDWNLVWGNVHNKMLPYKTQSSLWIMTNLNFISAFSLNRMYNTPNVCCKCVGVEEGYAHCFLFCSVSNLVYMYFISILRQLVDM